MILVICSPEKAASSKLAGYALKEFSHIVGIGICDDAEYLHRADGSPYFSGENMPYVSVSHSGAYSVAAVSLKQVGIDVQEHKSVDFKSISERFGMKADDEKDFFEKFAAAEAKTKALRIPLTESLRSDNSEVRVFGFIPGYTLALYGEGTPVLMIYAAR